MAEDNKITVTRVVDAPAKEIFDVLTLPRRHQEFDGSGMVRADEKSQRIQGVGDVFVMNMYAENQGGDYKMFNHVTAYAENQMVGWQPAQEKAQDKPAGWEWLYELKSQGSDSTEVALTYDWSKVDKEVAKQIGFPAVSEEQLEESLNQLASAVAGS